MLMKEHEIRPRRILGEFLRLLEADTATFFANGPRVELNCPACDAQSRHAFTKNGFSYAECPRCATLYASPRPERAAFERFYRDSESTRYWATTFYRETEAARRQKLWKPKAQMIKDSLAKHAAISDVVDIGGGYGVFGEEIRRITAWTVTIVEPSRHLAQVCRDKGFAVIEKFLEDLVPSDLPKRRKCFVSFELLEHLFDPGEFLRRLNGLMSPGDLLVLTTLSGTGLDIQVLWERSKAVSPPHHINFFNPASLRQLLGKTGFSTLEISTPGKLDLDILANNLPLVQDRFWRGYLLRSSDADRTELQAAFARQGLSSHMMAICAKVDAP